MKGKTKLMKKKLSQLTEPAIMNAAGRAVCVNSSVVRMLVTPPLSRQKPQGKSAVKCNEVKYSWFIHLPGPKPKLKMKAKTHAMLKYGKTGLTS